MMKEKLSDIIILTVSILLSAFYMIPLAKGGDIHHIGANDPTTESPPWGVDTGGTVSSGTDTVNSVEYPYWQISTAASAAHSYKYQGIPQDFSGNWALQAVVRVPQLSTSLFNANITAFEGTRFIGVGLRSDGLFWYDGTSNQRVVYQFTPDPNKYYTILMIRNRALNNVVHIFLDGVERKELPIGLFPTQIYYTNMVFFGDLTLLGGASITRWNAVNFYTTWTNPIPSPYPQPGLLIRHYGAENPLNEIRPWNAYLNSSPSPGTDTVNQIEYPYWQIATANTWTYYYWQGISSHFTNNWALRAVVRAPTLTSHMIDCLVVAFEGTRACGVGLQSGGLYYLSSSSPPYQSQLYAFTPDTALYYEIVLKRDQVNNKVKVFLNNSLCGELTFSSLPIWGYYTNAIHFGDWGTTGASGIQRWHAVEFYPAGLPIKNQGMVVCIR